ncbi:hypothetical protein A3B48_03270 [Candidatus Gottesmanbacteria bacterium RIFCSPLOWO2_01_FULL_40_10]|nr:MAG: hypothetical protein A3B48_03270 [Candidatus Gottesmanbacteria bacterium RIFCSPLOWO2_01_FULL_40_10]
MRPNLECLDISQPVADLRVELGIPDQFEHQGVIYPVLHPKILVLPDHHELSQMALENTIMYLTEYPEDAITFPTGNTWKEHYALMEKQSGLFKNLLKGRKIATVDEYYPVYSGHPNYPISYKVYTDQRLGIPLGISPEQWIRPDGAAADPFEEADRFERELQSVPFSLTNLGIGPDPKIADGSMIPPKYSDKQIENLIRSGHAIEGSSHIGFVPKGTPPDSGAIYVRLDRGTIFENSRGVPAPDQMPDGAITQAHGDFSRSKIRVMAASGELKPRNVEKVLLESPGMDNPASLVTLGESMVLLDQAAAARVLDRIANRKVTLFHIPLAV